MFCVHSCSFLVLTPGGLSPRGQCACISVSTTESICIHSYLMLVHAHTEAWPCVHKLFSFYSCGQDRDRIPSSKYTVPPSNESPLSSASTALSYSSFHALPNGFSNAGTWFLSRLDKHFPLCLGMRIKPWVVRCCLCCWEILHTDQEHFSWTCLRRPNARCLYIYFHMFLGKATKIRSCAVSAIVQSGYSSIKH